MAEFGHVLVFVVGEYACRAVCDGSVDLDQVTAEIDTAERLDERSSVDERGDRHPIASGDAVKDRIGEGDDRPPHVPPQQTAVERDREQTAGRAAGDPELEAEQQARYREWSALVADLIDRDPDHPDVDRLLATIDGVGIRATLDPRTFTADRQLAAVNDALFEGH